MTHQDPFDTPASDDLKAMLPKAVRDRPMTELAARCLLKDVPTQGRVRVYTLNDHRGGRHHRTNTKKRRA